MCRNFSLSAIQSIQTNYRHMKNCMLSCTFEFYNALDHKLVTIHTRFTHDSFRTDDREGDHYIVDSQAHTHTHKYRTPIKRVTWRCKQLCPCKRHSITVSNRKCLIVKWRRVFQFRIKLSEESCNWICRNGNAYDTILVVTNKFSNRMSLKRCDLSLKDMEKMCSLLKCCKITEWSSY